LNGGKESTEAQAAPKHEEGIKLLLFGYYYYKEEEEDYDRVDEAEKSAEELVKAANSKATEIWNGATPRRSRTRK
jgi:hypothetical protein